MTEQSKKQQLYEAIRANPFISQQELANQLGLSRSAVAGYIAGLIRERKLLGRAYVLPDRRPVVCVGAANLDRKLRSLGTLVAGTSNPASQTESFGGVARNIAENLARLGTPVALLTAIGGDSSGAALLEHAESLGIDTRGALRFADAYSGTYTAVLAPDGDMAVALADMALYDRVGPDFVAARQAQLAGAALTVVDLNLPRDTVAALVAQARQRGNGNDNGGVVVVAVSEPKMARLPQDLDGVRLLILNAGELAARVGRALDGDADLEAAMRAVQAQGARDVIVTRGAAGVLVTHGAAIARLPAVAPDAASVVDVTGAGDAFAAAVCWSLVQDDGAGETDLVLACRRGLHLADLTLATTATVRADIGPDTLATLGAAAAPSPTTTPEQD